MKFIQDICANLYNLDHTSGFEHDYDEEKNIIDVLVVQGNRRFVLISEQQLYRANPDVLLCLIVGFICDYEDSVVPYKELQTMVHEFTGRFKK